jgi:hypothetical protein
VHLEYLLESFVNVRGKVTIQQRTLKEKLFLSRG